MHLVVGATGLVGHSVAIELAKSGERVRALTRRSDDDARVAALRAAGAEIARGDLKDPASIAAACRGVRVVVTTASSTISTQAGDSLETVDRIGQLGLVDAARNAVVELGGPAAVSPLDVVRTFERATGRIFEVEHVPEQGLRAQFESAADPTQKSFAALMLGYATGDAIPMADTARRFGIQPRSIEDFARTVSTATA